MSAHTDEITVLLVDDDPDLATVAATFLERADERFAVETAASARAGRERLTETAVDCVVSDYEMPGQNGIAFLRAVREDFPDLPFVLFTGKGSEAVASEAISAGVTDYLQKEAGTEQYEILANRVRNAVEARRSDQMLTERTRRLETLISNLPGMVYRCRNEPDWPMETVEGEVESLTGYDAERLERNEVTWGETVLHPEDRDESWAAVQAALDAGRSFEVVYRIRTRGGETKWVWERGRGVEGADGDPRMLEGFITDITERKVREERLEHTTARLEALFENSPDMINVHDTEGNLLDPNPRFCERTGYDADELAEMAVWDVDQSIDPATARETWAAMDSGERLELEGVYRTKDGSTFPVDVHVQRLDVADEDRFVVISRDVSERAAREDDLRRYERIVNTMQEAACVYDEAGRFETVNEYLAAFYGTTPEALVGEESTLVPLIRESTDGDPYRELLDGDRTEICGEVEGEFPGAGHEVLAYRLTPFVVDGTAEGAVAVAHEVTEQRAYRRELEQTNALLSTLFETLPIGVLAEDADRGVLAANERLCELFGMPGSPDDLVGADCETLAAEASDLFAEPEAFVARIEELVADHEAAHDDGLALRDGRTVARSYRQIELSDGEGHLWVYQDTTEREARERRLQRERDRLDEFASVVSHDLRNPLQVATAAVELAGEECDSEHHQTAATALDRMARLVDDLLELARAGDDVGDSESVSLAAVARECWEHVAVGGATLRVETDRRVVADRSRLLQLVENLVRNAVEHGSTGSQNAPRSGDAVEHGPSADDPVTVTVGALPDGFYVADDGPGLPEGTAADVFEAGYSTSDDGTGFGLRIVERVATAHGWTVRATESEVGGARFEVTGVAFADG